MDHAPFGQGRLRIAGFTTNAEPSALACLEQVHGAEVYVVDASSGAPPRGDGLWTTTAGLIVAVRVADCVPILLWDPGAHAVAAVHAGWRGTAQDIVGSALDVGASLGVDPKRLHAALGPSIGPECFEVGPEVPAALRALGLDPDDFGERVGPRGRPHVDVRAANRALLRRRGVPDAQIHDVGGCTFCEPQYPSYRRDGARASRMRGLIALLLCLWVGPLGCATAPDTFDDVESTLASGDAAVSEAVLRGWLEAHPDDGLAWAQLAEVLRREDRPDEAVVAGGLALAFTPSLWEARYNLACSTLALGDREGALLHLADVAAQWPPSRALMAEDADLRTLHSDQRFRFLLDVGSLPTGSDQALLVVSDASIKRGEVLDLSVQITLVNRPPLAPRHTPTLRMPVTTTRLQLDPIERTERLVVGEGAGLEFHHIELRFRVRALAAGDAVFGPFTVEIDGQWLRTDAATVQIVEDDAPFLGGSAAVAASPDELDRFFRAPSEDEGPWVRAWPDHWPEWSPQESPPPWIVDGARKGVRFRALSADLPQRPAAAPRAFRSTSIRKSTEGWSWVVEHQL